MFRLVLCLVFLILSSEANGDDAENPLIRLYDYGLNTFISNKNFVVRKDEPLYIYIHNDNPRQVWCSYYDKNNDEAGKIVADTESTKDDDIIILNVTRVTAEMSTRWVCTTIKDYHSSESFYYPYENPVKHFRFRLHVKGAKSVQLSVNGKELAFSEVDMSARYDGDATYFYEDGEQVQVVCRNPHINGSVHLEYSASYNDLRLQTKGSRTNISDSGIFFIQYSERNNSRSYIDCVYETTDPVDSYIYRVFFKKDWKKDPHYDVIIIRCIGSAIMVLFLVGICATIRYCWKKSKRLKRVQLLLPQIPDGKFQPASEEEGQNDKRGNTIL